MKIALVSLNDSADVHQWSGLNYHIARSLERAGAQVHRVGPLASTWTPMMKLRQRWYDAIGRAYHANMDPASLAALGRSAREGIPADADAVLSVTSLVAAAVGPLAIPHASWDDATNAAMEQYYPDFRRMAGASRRDSAVMGRRAVDAVDLAIYASDWAAHSARTAYGVDEGRIAVVPFGANLEVIPAGEDVERFIADRGDTICRLLWVGVDWRRKGGPLTVEIARALRDLGVDVELTVVGCEPEERAAFPDWVHVEGFISKRDEAGRMRLAALFARSHFFVMPSNAEAFGLVYAEASAFGVPSVAIRTGGVPTIIVDGETGLLFDAGTSAVACATRMLSLFQDRSGYVSAARAARRRFSARLNWDVAGSEVLARLGHLAR